MSQQQERYADTQGKMLDQNGAADREREGVQARISGGEVASAGSSEVTHVMEFPSTRERCICVDC